MFDRDEFQKLLVACHNLLRDAHAMSPDQAFDTISKVLFIKLYIERSGNHGTFTTTFLDDRERMRLQGREASARVAVRPDEGGLRGRRPVR